MSYTSEYLQFGSNNVRVPGYEDDLILSNKPFAPIPKKLIDTLVDPAHSHIWDLIFSYESGGFYLPTSKVPGVDGATIESWYSEEGGGSGPHFLTFIPFVIDENGGGGFGQASHYVDFSEPSPIDGAINTDTLQNPSVTATVHSDLPEYSKLSFGTHATSHSIIITSTTTQALFEKIFVYAGSAVPVGNSLAVPQAQSCNALAVFKKTTSSTSHEISTIKYPKIPKSEWPQIVAQIVQQAITGNGEIYEFLSPSVITALGHEGARAAVAEISQRIESLNQIKSVISGLAKGK